MNLFVLVLAVLLPSGEMNFLTRTGPNGPEVFKTKEACEKQLAADQAEMKPELEKAQIQYQFACVPKAEFDKAIGSGKQPGA